MAFIVTLDICSCWGVDLQMLQLIGCYRSTCGRCYPISGHISAVVHPAWTLMSLSHQFELNFNLALVLVTIVTVDYYRSILQVSLWVSVQTFTTLECSNPMSTGGLEVITSNYRSH